MQSRGFTLVELIIVILVLAILSAIVLPKFLNISDDAYAAEVSETGAAFKQGITQAHAKWLIATNGYGPIDNLQVYGDSTEDRLDINANGWPAQNYFPFEADPQLNNVNDCLSVWRTITKNQQSSVSSSTDQTQSRYQARYLGAGQCEYIHNTLNTLKISYDSQTGEVLIDDDYRS